MIGLSSGGSPVDALEKRLNFSGRVQFWALLGPFVIVLTLLVGLIKAAPDSFELPLAALTGITACWAWRTRGMFLSLALLLTIFFWSYDAVPVAERFWHVGLALTLALGFVITTLARDEVSTLLRFFQEQSQSRLDQLLRLDETLKDTQQHWREDHQVYCQALDEATSQREQIENQLEMSKKALKRAQGEIEGLQGHREHLLGEIEFSKGEQARLQAEVHRAKLANPQDVTPAAPIIEKVVETVVEHVVDPEVMEELEALRSEKVSLSQELEAEKSQLAQATALLEEMREKVQADEQRLQEERKVHEDEVRDMEGALGELRGHQAEAQLSIQELQQSLKEQSEKLASSGDSEELELWREKARSRLNEINGLRVQMFQNEILAGMATQALKNESTEVLELDREVRRVQGMYKQLRQQFNDKCQVLHETRSSLFEMEGKLFVQQKEAHEQNNAAAETELTLQNDLLALQSYCQELEEENNALGELIGALNQQLHPTP